MTRILSDCCIVLDPENRRVKISQSGKPLIDIIGCHGHIDPSPESFHWTIEMRSAEELKAVESAMDALKKKHIPAMFTMRTT